MVHYVSKLTIASGTVTHHDVLELTNAGLSDREIHDIVMVSSCFAFMNRLADGTGVALQKNRYPFAVTLFGQEALDEHLIWANA